LQVGRAHPLGEQHRAQRLAAAADPVDVFIFDQARNLAGYKFALIETGGWSANAL
jgi:hypothetical protein